MLRNSKPIVESAILKSFLSYFKSFKNFLQYVVTEFLGLMRSKKTQERRQNTSSLVGLSSKAKTDPSRKKRHMQYTESIVDCLKGIAQARGATDELAEAN